MLIKAKIKNIIKNYFFKIPAELKRNYIYLSEDKMIEVENSIRNNYHKGWRGENKYTPEAYKYDLKAHLIDRLENDRKEIIPWLNTVRPLRGKKVLEIGCGTGSSSIALAEQGACVIGVDLDADALKVAEERKRIYQVDIEFQLMNATEVHNKFRGINFDYIIFFATIEHLVHEERMVALKETYNMLKPGALWVILETPNRLWFHDEHTSALPFFYWLPDDLAFKYSKYSPRKEISSVYREYNDETVLHFLRRGRGLSFHEFDLTMGDSRKLNIVSSKMQFEKYEWLRAKKLERRFKRFLKLAYPGLHDGFYDKRLDLVIKRE